MSQVPDDIQNDLLVRVPGGVFSLRTAGILIQHGQVLLQHPVGEPAHALPGGHVHFGEASAEALQREFAEEIGAVVHIGRLVAIQEHCWEWNGDKCHQVCFYYLVTSPKFRRDDRSTQPRTSDGAALEFVWVPLKDLMQLRLYPETIKDLLCCLPDGTTHIIDDGSWYNAASL